MNLTYMVRGADGKEYGPVSLEQLNGWIRESRLRGEQEVKRSDMPHWAAANTYEELQPMLGVATNAPPALAQGTSAQAVAPQTAATVAQMKSGASWFYWIAALSVVNSILDFTGTGGRFVFGLGITQLIDALASELGAAGKGVALGLDLLAAGILVLFGIFGQKGHAWAFIVGTVLYALDTVIFFLQPSWLAVGVHAFVVFCLVRGFIACRQLKAVT